MLELSKKEKKMTQELFKPSALARIEEEAEKTIPDMLKEAAAIALVAEIPIVGEAIKEMCTQLAFRRTHDRIRDMYSELGNKITEIGEEKIDRNFFKSEEFKTLLFEVLRQLHTANDKRKVEMLGRALANSGNTDFSGEDRKELFVQLVRELTPQHIALLTKLMPCPIEGMEMTESFMWPNRPRIQPHGDELLTSQILSGNGLLVEHFELHEPSLPNIGGFSSVHDIERGLKDYVGKLRQPPIRSFQLSELGRDFLKFVGIKPEPRNLHGQE